MYVLGKHWVDEHVKDWDEDEDHSRVQQLHLVGLDHVGAEAAVHTGSLERPAGTLRGNRTLYSLYSTYYNLGYLVGVRIQC